MNVETLLILALLFVLAFVIRDAFSHPQDY